MKKLIENFRRFVNEGEVVHVDFNRKKIIDPHSGDDERTGHCGLAR
jgi:hypothetical protein